MSLVSYKFSLCCNKAAEELRKRDQYGKKLPFGKVVRSAIHTAELTYSKELYQKVAKELSRRNQVKRAAEKAERERLEALELQENTKKSSRKRKAKV